MGICFLDFSVVVYGYFDLICATLKAEHFFFKRDIFSYLVCGRLAYDARE